MTFKLKSGNTTNFKQMGSSPLKASANYSDKAQNLLKAVPNKDEYNKLSDVDKQGFDKAAEKYGLPTKKESPAKQRVVKEGEGQDQDKIFNKKGEHIGDYVNGKKVMHTKAQHAKLMKSTKSVHGQLEDAERDSKADSRKKSPAKHPTHMDHHLVTEEGDAGQRGGPHPPTETDKKKESPAKQIKRATDNMAEGYGGDKAIIAAKDKLDHIEYDWDPKLPIKQEEVKKDKK